MKTKLSIEDFWNGNRYYLTDGTGFMKKSEFLKLQRQKKNVYVISDENNVFDLEFEVFDEMF